MQFKMKCMDYLETCILYNKVYILQKAKTRICLGMLYYMDCACNITAT